LVLKGLKDNLSVAYIMTLLTFINEAFVNE